MSDKNSIHCPRRHGDLNKIDLGNNHKGHRKQDNKRKASEFVRFVAADVHGEAHEIDPLNVERSCRGFLNHKEHERHGLLKQFIYNELGGDNIKEDGKIPRHIHYMKKLELLDYCEVSEKGHFKWYPNGVLLRKLLMDHAADLALKWGAFEMINPILIRGDHNTVGELMGEFHERDYRVDGGRGIGYLRYASDPLAFPFMQKVRFTHKQAPLKVYEEASCFRNEQQGEVSGLKRVRNFMMTDMHAACVSEAQAREEFEALCGLFAQLMNHLIASGRWVLGWEGTKAFYEQHHSWLLGIGKKLGVPAFFKLMPEMSHYYSMKNEFQAMVGDSANIQISTVQWDIKDGQRFDIGFIDEHGEKRACPVILHASSFGSIERALCAILENIAMDEEKGKKPMLPLWLSPVQVRLIPVSQKYVHDAEQVFENLNASNIRADMDDRDMTVAKKIADSEKAWVPYLAVIGEREKISGKLNLRSRDENPDIEMPVDRVAGFIQNKVGPMPFRRLFLPARLSKRPMFS